LIMQSWLIGVGWVIYGGQLFGRWSYDAWLRAWVHSRFGQAEPGGGKEGEQGEQDPGNQSTPPG
jgi:membrane protein